MSFKTSVKRPWFLEGKLCAAMSCHYLFTVLWFQKTLICIIFEHNLIFWIYWCVRTQKTAFNTYQQEDSIAPNPRPTLRDDWSWRVAAARSTVESCSTRQIICETSRNRRTLSGKRWSAQPYLARVQQALGQVFSSKGVSSLIFWAVLNGRGSKTCSTKLP